MVEEAPWGICKVVGARTQCYFGKTNGILLVEDGLGSLWTGSVVAHAGVVSDSGGMQNPSLRSHDSSVWGGGDAPPMVTIPLFGGSTTQAYGEASLRIVATAVDKDGMPLGDLEAICQRAWEAEFVKDGMTLVPPLERQKEYTRLSGLLRSIRLRYKADFQPSR
jgi:hypothetical protein